RVEGSKGRRVEGSKGRRVKEVKAFDLPSTSLFDLSLRPLFDPCAPRYSSPGGPPELAMSLALIFPASNFLADSSILPMVLSNSARGAFCPGLAARTKRSGLTRAITNALR